MTQEQLHLSICLKSRNEYNWNQVKTMSEVDNTMFLIQLSPPTAGVVPLNNLEYSCSSDAPLSLASSLKTPLPSLMKRWCLGCAHTVTKRSRSPSASKSAHTAAEACEMFTPACDATSMNVPSPIGPSKNNNVGF